MKYEVVQRIPKYYVTEDGVQVMISHLNGRGITILNAEAVIYHYYPGSANFINAYTEEMRKDDIPYSKIYNYVSRVGFRKYEYINQFLKYNIPYLQISDGGIIEHYVVKLGEEALIATKLLVSKDQYFKMTKQEIEELVQQKNYNIYYTNGGMALEFDIPEIGDVDIKSMVDHAVENEGFPDYYIAHAKESIYKEIKQKEKNIINDILKRERILIDNEDKELTNICSLSMFLLNNNEYTVKLSEYKICKYSLAQLMQLESSSHNKMAVPKISISLNPHIDENEIIKARELILKRK